MLLINKNTVAVSATDLKRNYKAVQNYLNSNIIVIITNRNNRKEADGIFLPYSKYLIEKLEDILEDSEMEANKEHMIKDFQESYSSGNQMRIKIEDL